MIKIASINTYFKKLGRRKTIYLGLGILATVIVVWAIVQLRASADVINSARPKILPIDKKNLNVNDRMRLPIYVSDQDETDMDKMRLIVDWGDGSAVQNMANEHPENLTELAGSPLLKTIVTHAYQKIGTYTITITAQDSTDTKSIPYTIPMQVFAERDTGSVNYPPTISSLTDASIATLNKEFNYWIEFFDYSDISLQPAKVTIDWGDGSDKTITQEIQPTREYHPNKADFKQTIVKKTYSKTGAYVVTITVTDGEGESTQDQMIIIVSDAVVNPEIRLTRATPIVTAGGQYQFEYQLIDRNGSDFSETEVDWGDGKRDKLPAEPLVPTEFYRSFYQSDGKPGYFNFKTTKLIVFGHQYRQPGDYNFSVNIKDSEGGIASNNIIVQVMPGVGLEFEEKFFAPKSPYGPDSQGNVLPEPWYVVGENYSSYLKNTNYWQYNPLFRWELFDRLNNKDGYAYYSTDRDSNFATLMRDLSKEYNPTNASLINEFDFMIGGVTNQGAVSFGFINNKATELKNAATLLLLYDKDKFKAYSAFDYDGEAYSKDNNSIVEMSLSEPLQRHVSYHGVVELINGTLTTKILSNSSEGKIIGQSTVKLDASKITKGYSAWGVINYSDGLDVKLNPLYPSWNGISWGYLDNVTVYNLDSSTITPVSKPELKVVQPPIKPEENLFTPDNIQSKEQAHIETVKTANAEAGQFLQQQSQLRTSTSTAQANVEKLNKQLGQTTDDEIKAKVEKQLKLANQELTVIQEESAVATEGKKSFWIRIGAWFTSLWNSILAVF